MARGIAGAGLAAVTPAWMRYAAPKHLPLFGQFAVEVMGVRGSLRDPEELAEAGISALEDFSRRMGLLVRLHELGIGGGDFALMAEKSVQKGGGTLQYGGTSQGAINMGTYGIDPSGLAGG